MTKPALVAVMIISAPFAAAADSLATAQAASTDEAWHVRPTVLLGFESFHYEEHGGGIVGGGTMVLDKNEGVLPNAELGAELTSPRSHFFARASLRFADGSGQYIGALQDGTPLSGPTKGYMLDGEVTVGGRGHIAGAVLLGGFAGFGHHTWDRDITSVSTMYGYREQYDWAYGVIGVRADIAAGERTSIMLEGAGMVPLTGGLSETNSPLIDDMHFDLSVDFCFRARVVAAYAITPAVRITAGAAIDQYTILGSSSAPVTMNGQPIVDGTGDPLYAQEPYSKTTRLTLDAGAGYVF